jgi:hypothetical protein
MDSGYKGLVIKVSPDVNFEIQISGPSRCSHYFYKTSPNISPPQCKQRHHTLNEIYQFRVRYQPVQGRPTTLVVSAFRHSTHYGVVVWCPGHGGLHPGGNIPRQYNGGSGTPHDIQQHALGRILGYCVLSERDNGWHNAANAMCVVDAVQPHGLTI